MSPGFALRSNLAEGEISYMLIKSQEGMETLLRGVHMDGAGSMPVPSIRFYAALSFVQLFWQTTFSTA